jgi:acetyltransferase-like isoleucine patch superfamily enzyme
MIFKIFWLMQTFFYRLIINHIGLLSYIGKPIYIHGGRRIYIGNKVRIFPGVRMETHQNGRIFIAENVSVGQNFHIISAKEMLRIGAHTTISGNVFITNIEHDYRTIDKHILDQKCLIKTTSIGEYCFIGYGASIQAGTILGKQCVVGANAVVRGVFPDYCVIAGVPARIIKKYNPENYKWETSSEL